MDLVKWLYGEAKLHDMLDDESMKVRYEQAAKCIEAADKLKQVAGDLRIWNPRLGDAFAAYDAARNPKEGSK
jgi:hypothetical protein